MSCFLNFFDVTIDITTKRWYSLVVTEMITSNTGGARMSIFTKIFSNHKELPV